VDRGIRELLCKLLVAQFELFKSVKHIFSRWSLVVGRWLTKRSLRTCCFPLRLIEGSNQRIQFLSYQPCLFQ
jgi:hypothetical protein